MEYMRKCNVCGHIWCYTDEDVKASTREALTAGIAAIGTVANAIGGTRYDAYEQNKIANNASSKIVDYVKCPHCNSRDTIKITKEDLNVIKDIEQKKKNNYFTTTPKDEIIKKIENYIKNRDYLSAELYMEQIIEARPVELTQEEVKLYIMKLYIDYKASNDDELIEKCISLESKLEDNQYFDCIIKFGDEQTTKKYKEISDKISEGVDDAIDLKMEKDYDEKVKKNKKIARIFAIGLISVIVIVLIFGIKSSIERDKQINAIKNSVLSKRTEFYGGDEGRRTPVHNTIHTNFSECSLLLKFI